jgi:hypothetical protein
MIRPAFFYPVLALVSAVLVFSCKKSSDAGDADQLEKNVRAFFFLGDSVDVAVTITDTIRVEELNGMIQTVSDNFNLIQQDIDTLGLMIDDWSYKALDLEKQNLSVESKDAQIKALEYRVKRAELEATQANFFQTNRILNRLKRSIWADIAGFDATATFTINGEQQSHALLLDAKHNIVD